MVALTLPPRLNLPIAQGMAIAAAVLAATLIALVPAATLESLSMASGLPALLPAAAPPLGLTARLALMFVAVLGVAALVWSVAYLLVGRRILRINFQRRIERPCEEEGVPVLRRADAHPDAPPRPPVFAARDLGTPFLDVTAKEEVEPMAGDAAPSAAIAPPPVERPLPRDLDERLAAYDPGALPSDEGEPIPRPAVFDSGERFETFELTPPVRPQPAPERLRPPAEPRMAAPETEATVHALLSRLERGVASRRARVETPVEQDLETGSHGLDEALATLRKLAVRA